MESTALTARLPIPLSRSRSKLLSPSPFAGARRLASVPLPSSSGRVVLLSCGGRKYAGVGSSVVAAAASGEAADAGSEAILLSVQPEVTSATVDFKQASAVVWTTAEAKASEDWQKQCGEKLAKHLGTCGFESSPQGK
ncbi:hypothetical protein EJB05_11135 [Eragrostis curvula]|uniref:Uncharacterized protein n=1 Tax=Eragrostis curvula TaxID=38414 RepID=A0A5J9VRQ4_9POAL|nr:hypothetical protein EJB05_11135 [Eragrostis curvula]